MFDNIKYFYERLGWTKEQVNATVGMGWITQEQADEIIASGGDE